MKPNAWMSRILLSLAGTAISLAATAGASGEAIMKERCIACHGPEQPGKDWLRISDLRKTPEGWAMTIDRMQTRRGVQLTDEEKRAVVKHLADNQGLAPEESAPFRYVLERAPNIVEDRDETLTEMCARCHSRARPSLQRRTAEEWERLVHFHVGQFPTMELHALARDRQWFDVALKEVVPYLAKNYPLDTDAWNAWKAQPKPELSGTWQVAGYLPVDGDYQGELTVRKTGTDEYAVALKGRHANGKPLEGTGAAIVYTGHEWRAELKVNGVPLRQVFTASKDGRQLAGRMFQAAHDEIGGEVKAVKNGSGSHVLAVSPSYLKAGQTSEVTIIGSALQGPVSFGPDVRVQMVSRTPGKIVLRATAKPGAEPGLRSLRVGRTQFDEGLAVYDRVARVAVEPGESIARVGDNGTTQAKVRSSYRALAFAAGKDGQPGTEDDIRLGFMPASWSVKAFNEVAEHDHDTEFAGVMDATTGVFTPGDAGPNPKRKMSTNNVGNLAVVATVKDGAEALQGEAHLLVTVQTYMNPRIR